MPKRKNSAKGIVGFAKRNGPAFIVGALVGMFILKDFVDNTVRAVWVRQLR